MFIPLLSYGISTTSLQILVSLQFPIHPSKGVHWCSRKRLFEFSGAFVHRCFEKITAPKISAYFLTKHPEWSIQSGVLFKHTCRPSWDFPKRSLEQPFCREPLRSCLYKKKLHSTRYIRNF